MKELSIVGSKNAGKTTLVEKLIALLITRGISVGTIKHTSHSHGFDTPGKDSHRHRAAGSTFTIASGPNEIALFAANDSPVTAGLISLINDNCDLCLIEGDKASQRPKVLIVPSNGNLPDPLPNNIVASWGDGQGKTDIPHFDSDDCTALVEFIVRRLELENLGVSNEN